MSVFHSLIAARVVVILGIVNALTALGLFASCRCLMGSRIGAGLTKYRVYRRLCKYHCRIWKAFWPSVVVHAFLAVMLLGWPA